MRTLAMTAVLATLAMGSAAAAQTMATASTDLNVRSGPGIQYPVMGVIGGGSDVSVLGCVEGINWCEVSTPEGSGWSYGDYLTVALNDAVVPLYPNFAQAGVAVVPVPVVTPGSVVEYTSVGALTAPSWETPVEVVPPFAPVDTISTYVTTNTVEPVYLDGEVVLGAVVPETVNLYEIPTAPEYRYVQVNGQTVLVDAATRNVVYVYR